MRIFLSYATEQRAAAESIAYSLRSQGHSVFMDRDDLPAGQSYDDQIRAAIKSSELMIFLVSPQSVTKGRYTLTEIEFARQAWRHPANRVMPVMAEPTSMGEIPNFLKGVTILEPQGNLTAEVCAAVERLRTSSTKVWQTTRRAAALTALVFSVTLIAVALFHHFLPAMSEENSKLILPLLFGVIFGVPISAVLRTWAPQPSWKVWTPMITTAIAILAAWSIDLELAKPFDTEKLGVMTGAAAGTNADPAKTGEAGEETRDAPKIDPEMLRRIESVNIIWMRFNEILKSLVLGGLVMIGLLAGATLATAELRSPLRWAVSVAVASLALAVLLLPVGSAWSQTSELTDATALMLAAILGTWIAVMGGLIGHWIARGEPG